MAKKKAPVKKKMSFRISESEWYVMKVIWDSPEPLNANEIVEQVIKQMKWNPKTVRSFLNRLVKKGVLNAVKKKVRGYECLYFIPQVTSAQALEGKRVSFFERFFEGTLQTLLTTFIESGELSNKDLDDLRQTINNKIGDKKTVDKKTGDKKAADKKDSK